MAHIPSLLIVDDEPAILKLVSEFATRYLDDVRVDTAESPYAALDLLKRVDYDVVISDVDMRGMNGLDLTSHIRRMCPTSTIVLMSGGAHSVDEVWSHDIFAYLSKPMDCQSFIHTVYRAIHHTRSWRFRLEHQDQIELSIYARCYGD